MPESLSDTICYVNHLRFAIDTDMIKLQFPVNEEHADAIKAHHLQMLSEVMRHLLLYKENCSLLCTRPEIKSD